MVGQMPYEPFSASDLFGVAGFLWVIQVVGPVRRQCPPILCC
jgi:hypothetical protein